jgi:hypothetical protein
MFGPPTRRMSRADHPRLFWAAVVLNVVFPALIAWAVISRLLGWPDVILHFR